MDNERSFLQKLRMTYKPNLPSLFNDLTSISIVPSEYLPIDHKLKDTFVKTFEQPTLKFKKGNMIENNSPLKVGIVFSGGQAAGGHNVVSGVFDALQKLNPNSRLIGFLDGPKGIIENRWREISSQEIDLYRNQGGFNLLGSGRTKIETDDQFVSAAKTVNDLNLDGLIVVGGDDSNTNAALLAEYFLQHQIKTRVIGIPKTIDGDLQSQFIEISFGFDSATKTYSEIIGNTLIDAISAKKYTFFIKLMGRTASHIALECALATHPNLTLIGEEVESQNRSLNDLVVEITNLVIERSKLGKDYGVILIPEGLIEFIPECKILIKELNTLLSSEKDHVQKIEEFSDKESKISYASKLLSDVAKKCLLSLPIDIQIQLLMDRDPHGNVQVSKIDTERLLMEMVEKELKKESVHKVKFSPQPLFCGYEGRSCLPSNFDCDYCYSLGYQAVLLIQGNFTGYICTIQNLSQPVEKWQMTAVPIVSMIHLEERKGKQKPVIKKTLVDLQGPIFKKFAETRKSWQTEDSYINPGPIQFYGPEELTNKPVYTIFNHH